MAFELTKDFEVEHQSIAAASSAKIQVGFSVISTLQLGELDDGCGDW